MNIPMPLIIKSAKYIAKKQWLRSLIGLFPICVGVLLIFNVYQSGSKYAQADTGNMTDANDYKPIQNNNADIETMSLPELLAEQKRLQGSLQPSNNADIETMSLAELKAERDKLQGSQPQQKASILRQGQHLQADGLLIGANGVPVGYELDKPQQAAPAVDYSKMSDEDLLKIVKPQQAAQPDLTKLSDAELDEQIAKLQGSQSQGIASRIGQTALGLLGAFLFIIWGVWIIAPNFIVTKIKPPLTKLRVYALKIIKVVGIGVFYCGGAGLIIVGIYLAFQALGAMPFSIIFGAIIIAAAIKTKK